MGVNLNEPLLKGRGQTIGDFQRVVKQMKLLYYIERSAKTLVRHLTPEEFALTRLREIPLSAKIAGISFFLSEIGIAAPYQTC
jgi:hypothetical protein